ncbi:hypothetical protein ES702_06306 [subsurface metagenome]
MADYILKNVDDNLWRQFKAACAFYEMDMKGELVRHMRNVVSSYNKHRQDEDKAKAILKTGRKKP